MAVERSPYDFAMSCSELMLADHWPEIPVIGEEGPSAWPKLLAYITWLREFKGDRKWERTLANGDN